MFLKALITLTFTVGKDDNIDNNDNNTNNNNNNNDDTNKHLPH